MKRIFILLSCLTLCAGLFSSCEGQDAVYSQFQEEGPVVYLGKVQNVVVASGANRARLTWAPSDDPRIKSATISWNNGAGTQTLDWDPSQPFETTVEGLPEGSIIFEIVTNDTHGNHSVPVSVNGIVYGDQFASLLEEASIVSSTYNAADDCITVTIQHSSSYYYRFLEILYTDKDGVARTVSAARGENTIQFYNSSSLAFQYHSVFVPNDECIDDFDSATHEYTDLATPYMEFEGDKALLAAAAGCQQSIPFRTNRAPFVITSDGEDWLEVTEFNGAMRFVSKSKNTTGDARIAHVHFQVGDFTKELIVKQTMDRVGTAYGTEGVIWWQNTEDPTEYKMISAARGNCKWSIVTVATGATGESGKSSHNGQLMSNIDIIKELGIESYPAFAWCENLGEGWYLPSGAELKSFIEVYNGSIYTYAQLNGKKVSTLNAAAGQCREKFEQAMESMGAPRLNTAARDANGDWLWGTQEVNASNAYAARLGVSGYGSRSKKFDGNEASGPFYTRAMKVFHIEE